MGIIVDNEPVPELTCGDFSCSTGWTAKPDWTIAGGVAVVVNSLILADSWLYQILGGQINHIFRLKFDVSAIAMHPDQVFVAYLFGEFHDVTANGSYTFYTKAGDLDPWNGGQLNFFMQWLGAAFVGDTATLDNVELIDVTNGINDQFYPVDGTKYDSFDIDGEPDEIVLRYAHWIDRTRYAIRIDPNLLPP